MKVTREQRAAWTEGAAQSPFNQWLDGLVRRRDGGLDLEALHTLAREYGVDRQTQYAHLNPGQQRMNIGNMLRRLVPENVYDKSGLNSVDPSVAIASRPASLYPSVLPTASMSALEARASRPEFIRSASVLELLKMHGQLLDELRDRKVIRTGNSPLGDYAELLFATAFGWSLASNSAAGHDAVDAEGVRYQIKARRLTATSRSRQLSAIRKLPDQTFDMLAAVIFDEDYLVQRAILLPHAEVKLRCVRVEHTNSWRFVLHDHVWGAPGAIDVTSELSQVAIT